MHKLLTILLVALATYGCFGDDFGSSSFTGGSSEPSAPESYPAPPSALNQCLPTQTAWNRINQLYVETEYSIHELITCGQVQVRLSKSMLAIVLASNEDLFRGDTFERLVEYADSFGLDLKSPFERGESGRWVMPIPGGGEGSRFWVQFFEPDHFEPILADPFKLESYVTGVHVDTTISLDEMWEDLDRQNVFTFTWEEEGPLVGLLNNGEPLPNPFTVTASIFDIASLVTPWFDPSEGADFGALISLVDSEMISCVELSDKRGQTEIEYRADGRRDTISNIASGEGVAFDVDRIQASDGTYELSGDANDLRFLGVKNLAGTIDYKVTGPEVNLRIVSDFRDGSAWPTAEWSCGHDCP